MLSITTQVKDYIIAGLGAGLVLVSALYLLTDARLDAEVNGRAADAALYKQAQAEYTLKATEEKNRIENESKQAAIKADEDYDALFGKYRSVLVRLDTTRRTYSGPDPTRSTDSTESVDGPSGSTELPEGLITIPYSDAEVCAVNTARLQIAHDWALENLTVP